MKLENLDIQFLEKCRLILKDEQSNSLKSTNNWEHVDKKQVHFDWDVLYKELSPLISGSSPDDQAIQNIVKRHYQIISRFYLPSKEGYIGLGIFYREDQAMRDFHNSYHLQMAIFLSEAMTIYALNNL